MEEDANARGLDAVPPHRRETIRLRVAAIRRHIANPAAHPASAEAAELGMNAGSFRVLVRAWRASADPLDLMGAGVRKRQEALSAEQLDVIAAAAAAMPGAMLERIAERAQEIGRERSVGLPGWAALVKAVADRTAGRLPTASPAASADLVVETCVVDVPVLHPGADRAVMPVATLVTRVADPAVVGLSLSIETPTAADAALALAEACRSGRVADAPDRAPAIYAQFLEGGAWDEIAAAIRDAGIRLEDRRSAMPSPPMATVRLLGRRPAGIALKPRLGRRPAIARPAPVPVGASPIGLVEAARFLRARWTVTPARARDAAGPHLEALLAALEPSGPLARLTGPR